MRLAQHLRQLGEVRRHSSRLVASEQLGRRSPAGLILEVEIGERLPGTVADDEAGVVRLIDRPGRREAAHGSDERHFRFAPKATLGHPEAARR